MKFDASDEQQQLQVITRRFLESTVPLPTVRLLAEKAPAGFDRDWWRQAAGLGWVSLLVPEALGGSDADGSGLADVAIVAEERGRLVAPGPLLPSCVAAWTLAEGEPNADVRSVLDATVSGETICAWVLGERDSWLDAPPAVQAVTRDGGLELSGSARAVESGADADHLVVVVQMEDDQVAHVLVPGNSAGLHRDRVDGLDLVRRHADLRFDRVAVGNDAVVIAPDRGRSVLRQQTAIATIMQCAEMTGAAGRVLEMTLEYAGTRHSFGRPLASYQVLKHRFADMKLALEASLAAVEGAVKVVARGDADAAEAVSAAKLYVGRHSTDLVQDCIQIHGGMGVTWEHDLHLYLRRVTTERQLMGTPADHALHLASLLGL